MHYQDYQVQFFYYCKACYIFLDAKKGNQNKLLGEAVRTPAIYSTLYLCEKHSNKQHSNFHPYPSAEPALVCKECFWTIKYIEMKADVNISRSTLTVFQSSSEWRNITNKYIIQWTHSPWQRKHTFDSVNKTLRDELHAKRPRQDVQNQNKPILFIEYFSFQ